MRRIAGVLESNHISCYHGKLCPVASQWKVEWFGRVERCKVAVVLLSPGYFESEQCMVELLALITRGGLNGLQNKIIPVIVAEGVGTAMQGDFLGSNRLQQLRASTIRTLFRGNWLPAPDEGTGVFDGDVEGNSARLITAIRTVLDA